MADIVNTNSPVNPIPRSITPTSLDDEDLEVSRVTVGQNLPILPLGTKIDIDALRPVKLRHIVAVIDDTTISDALKDPQANIWVQDDNLMKELKAALPHGKKTALQRRVPKCLLFDAPTLLEKLIIVNWWASRTQQEKSTHIEELKRIYKRPLSSNDRVLAAAGITALHGPPRSA